MDINLCIFVGRLVKDPVEIDVKSRIESTENRCVELRLAINRPGVRLIHRVDYVNIRVWGSLATAAMTYCRKGKELGVIGEFQTVDYSYEQSEGKLFQVVKGKYLSFGYDTEEVRKEKAEQMRRNTGTEIVISEPHLDLITSIAGALMAKLKDISPNFESLPGLSEINKLQIES